jgi:hypothetical protein
MMFAIALLLSLNAYSAEIASINMKQVGDLLKEYVLRDASNKEKYSALDAEETNPLDIMKKDSDGRMYIDDTYLDRSKAMIGQFALKRELEEEMKRGLFAIIAHMELDYVLIYDSSDPATIIYSTATVADITNVIRQELYKLLSP